MGVVVLESGLEVAFALSRGQEVRYGPQFPRF